MRSFISFLSLLALLLCSAPLPAPAQSSVPALAVQTDQRQLAIAAALVLAGYEAPASPETERLRAEVRAALAGVSPELKGRLATFYRANRRTGVAEEADGLRYRALAVLINNPPTFALPIDITQVPADVRPVVGFAPLAAELYRSPAYRAAVPTLTAAYDAAARTVAASVQPAVAETLGYLRTRPIERVDVPALRDHKGNLLRPAVTRIRKLKVFADPLLGSTGPTVRDDLLEGTDEPFSQKPGDRFAIFTGDAIATDDPSVRLALLRFTIEPIVDRNREVLEEEATKLDAFLSGNEAAKRYANARVALVADSLVSAVAARQLVRANKLTENGAVALLGVAHESGEVMALHFYERLKRFEEVGLDVEVFYPDFVHSLDAARERGRTAQIAEARAARAMEPKTVAVTSEAFATEIIEADKLVTQKRFAEAKPILEKILAQSSGNARALFGLAQVVEHIPDPTEVDEQASDEDRASAQMERLERAVNLYRRAALNASPREQWLASWSHVYAGRILDFLDLRDEAVAEYQAAVKVGDVPQGAFNEAKVGVERPYEP